MLTYTPYQVFNRPTTVVQDTSYATASPVAPSLDVEYRQLVSRAVTQRLHSPSLDSCRLDNHDQSESWEMNERKFARDKAKTQVLLLGRGWGSLSSHVFKASITRVDEFVRDVQRAEREIHVLTPTRYEGVPKSVSAGKNVKAVKANAQRSFVMSTGEREEWRNAQQEHIMLFTSLAQARGGDFG